MPHPINHQRRADLLAGVVAYMLEHGVAGLSLRPLAAELGTSPRMLMHYFGSKEDMLVKAFETVRPDIATAVAHIQTTDEFRAAANFVWHEMCTGQVGRHVAVLMQVLSMSSADPIRVALAGYLADVMQIWMASLMAALVRCGLPSAVAEARATIVIASFRGLLLDRQTTHDVERTDAAARELVALATLPVEVP
ncbi:TetR/AcrR family transcriptional regulator [Antrihabitans cavernicola]|uniref:TetR/AcrR family transcriptional regulator n=1 Tax=Antrihabitans cavernicola TaxID=2495913 RepID=A0A5A7S5N3_9NOCA|nr:TetR/AcrR family transcriptional regulator [Spelaeibacter cavernicola]KAA0021186.1 TetR/AcrR family transcriptional regulator [Spelaeibacter cavernicola]